MVMQFPSIGEMSIQVGAVTFGNAADINFHLNEHEATDTVIAALGQIEYKRQVSGKNFSDLHQVLGGCIALVCERDASHAFNVLMSVYELFVLATQ